MKDTKLIHYLSTLSKVELNAFGRFVNSPFLNANPLCIELLNQLEAYYPEFEEEKVSKERMFKKLFPKEKLDVQKIRYVMTDLTRLLEEYFIYQEYSEHLAQKKHHLVTALSKRKLRKYAGQHQRQAAELLEKQPYRDGSYHTNLLLVQEDAYLLSAAQDERSLDSDLQSLSTNMDIAYLAKKLKYTCEIINRMNVLGVKYELPFLPNILDYLKVNPHDDIPAIAVYYKVLMTLTESENEQHYKELKQVLTKWNDSFPVKELRDTWGFAQNYCIRKINTGNAGYFQELFTNYTFLLEKEIIIENGFLAQFDFKNIVTIALRLKEFKWVESFIENYSDLLEPTHRQNAIAYNQARLHYGREQHKEALKQLLSVEFTDVYYHLDSKVLLLKIYYELDDYEPLLSLIDTFRVYLRRNKLISDYQKLIYTNFARFVKKLTRIKLGSKKPVKEIEVEIDVVKQIADIGWLKGKLVELQPAQA